jgi:hypothetical protein
MDNGEAFMRAQRLAQQQGLNRYNSYYQSPLTNVQNPYNPYRSSAGPPTPGERPEPEDLTGLRLLEQFLTKRREARDGNKGE